MAGDNNNQSQRKSCSDVQRLSKAILCLSVWHLSTCLTFRSPRALSLLGLCGGAGVGVTSLWSPAGSHYPPAHPVTRGRLCPPRGMTDGPGFCPHASLPVSPHSNLTPLAFSGPSSRPLQCWEGVHQSQTLHLAGSRFLGTSREEGCPARALPGGRENSGAGCWAAAGGSGRSRAGRRRGSERPRRRRST